MAAVHSIVMVGLAGVLVAAVSLGELLDEVRPYLAGRITVAQRVDAIVAGEMIPASSRWSRTLFIDDCLEVPRSFYALAQPTKRRGELLTACRDWAERMVVEAPTQSAAWLVVASAAAELDDFPTMRAALAKSRRSAPFLGWLADRRSALAERYLAELGPEERADHETDLAVMMLGAQSVNVLAQRFVRRPDLRPLLTRIAEAAPVAMQRHFLDQITMLATGGDGQ